jgi:hypothetical protein
MRFLGPILLAMLVVQLVHASESDPQTLAAEQLAWLETANVNIDAQRDIRSGSIRFFGLPGAGPNIPRVGLLRYAMCYEGYADLEFLPTGGVVWGSEHLRLRALAYEYAEAYNSIVLSYLGEQGRSDCSSHVDWEAGWSAIEQYLRSDRKRERGTFSLGPDTVHVYLNHFSKHTAVAAKVCSLLRRHALDRDISVIITPRDLINTPAEEHQRYELECHPEET